MTRYAGNYNDEILKMDKIVSKIIRKTKRPD